MKQLLPQVGAAAALTLALGLVTPALSQDSLGIVAGEGVEVSQPWISVRLVAPLGPEAVQEALVGNTAVIYTEEGYWEYEYHRPNHLTYNMGAWSDGAVVEGFWYLNGEFICWDYGSAHCKIMWETEVPGVLAEVYPDTQEVRQLWYIAPGDAKHLVARSSAIES